MRERQRRRFPHIVKQEVRQQQDNRCAICGAEGHLSVHHVQPHSAGRRSTADNAVGLCRFPCRDLVDELTIEKGIPFGQIMENGITYYLPLFDQLRASVPVEPVRESLPPPAEQKAADN